MAVRVRTGISEGNRWRFQSIADEHRITRCAHPGPPGAASPVLRPHTSMPTRRAVGHQQVIDRPLTSVRVPGRVIRFADEGGSLPLIPAAECSSCRLRSGARGAAIVPHSLLGSRGSNSKGWRSPHTGALIDTFCCAAPARCAAFVDEGRVVAVDARARPWSRRSPQASSRGWSANG